MKNIRLFIFLVFVFMLAAGCKKNRDVEYEYYADGTLKSEIQMKNGMRNGITKKYDEIGRLISTAELKDDKYEGWMIKYNPKNQKITAKALYKNDQQDGPATLYYADGQLYREMKYVNGRIDSLVKTYWPGGKLQAEVWFRMGEPAIGLKEYDKEGHLIKQPAIVVTEINQVSLLNKLTLKISLSDNTKKVNFFSGELSEDKYLSSKTPGIYDVDGVASLIFNVPRHETVMKKISIISRSRTRYGNTLVLHRYYNLAASN